MNSYERQHKSLLTRYDCLKKVLNKNERELTKLRQLVRVQHLNDNIDKVDLIHNIKNYLESEYVLDLTLKTRLQPYVKARCMFYWFSKRYTSLTLKEIGAMVGNLDHSTIIHGITIADQYIAQDKYFARKLKEYDEYILANFINPKVDTAESIENEIQVLREKLNKLSPSESKNIIFELC